MATTEIQSAAEYNRACVSRGVIKYYTSWCPACKSTDGTYTTIAARNPGVKFYRVNIDNVDIGADSTAIFTVPSYIVNTGKGERNSILLSKLEQVVSKI